MESIRHLLQQEMPLMEALIEAFDQIADRGDVTFIKFDGQRLVHRYTIIITFPPEKARGMIRTDTNDLKKGLLHALQQYVQ